MAANRDLPVRVQLITHGTERVRVYWGGPDGHTLLGEFEAQPQDAGYPDGEYWLADLDRTDRPARPISLRPGTRAT